MPANLPRSFCWAVLPSPGGQRQALSGHTGTLLSPLPFPHHGQPLQPLPGFRWCLPQREPSRTAQYLNALSLLGIIPLGCAHTATQQRWQLKAQQGSGPEAQQLPRLAVPGIGSLPAAEAANEPLLPLGNGSFSTGFPFIPGERKWDSLIRCSCSPMGRCHVQEAMLIEVMDKGSGSHPRFRAGPAPSLLQRAPTPDLPQDLEVAGGS